MEKHFFNLRQEPRGNQYWDLLDYAQIECKYALLVVRDSMTLGLKGEQILNNLMPFLFMENRSSEWPGTRLINNEARVFVYHYDPDAIKIFKKSVIGLYQWIQPDLPEDLCLLRLDDTPWLVTIAHENDGYFLLSTEEKAHLVKSLPVYQSIIEMG